MTIDCRSTFGPCRNCSSSIGWIWLQWKMPCIMVYSAEISVHQLCTHFRYKVVHNVRNQICALKSHYFLGYALKSELYRASGLIPTRQWCLSEVTVWPGSPRCSTPPATCPRTCTWWWRRRIVRSGAHRRWCWRGPPWGTTHPPSLLACRASPASDTRLSQEDMG